MITPFFLSFLVPTRDLLLPVQCQFLFANCQNASTTVLNTSLRRTTITPGSQLSLQPLVIRCAGSASHGNLVQRDTEVDFKCPFYSTDPELSVSFLAFNIFKVCLYCNSFIFVFYLLFSNYCLP